ncbi:MAG: 30S ribosomal protein S6 [candidate division WOR-3 bacterium]
MREYEMMFILDPELDVEKRKEIYNKLENLIKENGGEILKVDDWGIREFAYPIRHKNSGFYSVWEFKSGPELPIFLRNQIRLIREIFRVMILRKENVKSFKGKKEVEVG